VRNEHSHELTSMECRRLLAQRRLGRVAVVGEDGPAVYPVNYTLDRDAVLLHTDEPSSFGQGSQVTLQVDDLDESRPAGWSVVVRGRAAEVEQPDELGAGGALPLPPGAGRSGHYVRLRQVSISGRRIDRDPGADLPSNWLG
jgi:uncharacterized protein